MTDKATRLAEARGIYSHRIEQIDRFRYTSAHSGAMGATEARIHPGVRADDAFDAIMEHSLLPKNKDHLYAVEQIFLDNLGLPADQPALVAKLRGTIQNAIEDGVANHLSPFFRDTTFRLWVYYDQDAGDFKFQHTANGGRPSKDTYPKQFEISSGYIMDYAYIQGITHENADLAMGDISERGKGIYRQFKDRTTADVDNTLLNQICEACLHEDQNREGLLPCYFTGMVKGAEARAQMVEAGKSVDHLKPPTKLTDAAVEPAVVKPGIGKSN